MISGNETSEAFQSRGGGLHGEFHILRSTIANTVLALNTATNGGLDCSGTIISQGHNLVENNSGCGLIAFGTDKINLPAGLASVANNGGLTAGSSLGTVSAMQTRSPLPNSLLVDAGNNTGCRDEASVLLATDQVGRDRAIDGLDLDTDATCDIGAVEYLEVFFKDSFE